MEIVSIFPIFMSITEYLEAYQGIFCPLDRQAGSSLFKACKNNSQTKENLSRQPQVSVKLGRLLRRRLAGNGLV